jgi:protein-disulfide isomerase
MKKLHHHIKSTEGKFVLSILAIVVLLLAYYFFATAGKTDVPVEDITISSTDHIRGAADGILTLVEFGDFQCPACGAYDPLVRQVVDDNKKVVKFVFKHFPLTQIHQNAMLGAKAAEAAGVQGKFWEMHDMLYDKQTDWSTGINARDFVMTYAKTLGLDTVKFANDLDSKAIEDKILAESKEAVTLGVQGTPTFFLNGKKLENPSSLEAFNKIILDAEAEAKAPTSTK